MRDIQRYAAFEADRQSRRNPGGHHDAPALCIDARTTINRQPESIRDIAQHLDDWLNSDDSYAAWMIGNGHTTSSVAA